MDKHSMIALGYPIGLGIAALGAGLGLGNAVGKAMEAISRQPEAAGKISLNMILGLAFIEALGIYALISPFIAGITFMAPEVAAVAPVVN